MNHISDNPFRVGARYRNRKGSFTVIALEGGQMRIRWDTGEEMTDTVASQARILRNIEREAAPTPSHARTNPVASSTPIVRIAPSANGKDLYPFSIYTIRQSGELKSDYKRGGSGELTENKPWTSAVGFLDHAKRIRYRLPLMFAAGERIRGIIYFAYIDEISISPPDENGKSTTTIRFTGLQPLRPTRPLSALRLKSSGSPLSDDFIKPYAICHTPDFLPPPDTAGVK